ncbi:hypothetical protein DTO271G3_4653 [Paecilomyces variotii]|nr:hypothetical protein DTO271G3_4653 [Paecilomyces variotii]
MGKLGLFLLLCTVLASSGQGTERTRIGQAASRRRDEHLWDTRRSRRLAYVRTRTFTRRTREKEETREKQAKPASQQAPPKPESKAKRAWKQQESTHLDQKPVQLPFAAQLPPEAHRAHRKEDRE